MLNKETDTSSYAVLKQRLNQYGRRVYIKNTFKAIAFYTIALTVLYAIDSSSELLNRQTQPIWIWSLFGLILAFPIWRWKFYRLVTHRSYYGVIKKR